MSMKTKFSEMADAIMIICGVLLTLFFLFLHLMLFKAGIHIIALYSASFILFLIAEKRQSNLWKKLALIGVLATPIFFLIMTELKFTKTQELYRSTFSTIKEKIVEDDILTLRIALDNFQWDGQSYSIEKLLHDLQTKTNHIRKVQD